MRRPCAHRIAAGRQVFLPTGAARFASGTARSTLVEEHRRLVCGMNLAMAEGLSDAIGDGLPYRPVLDPQPGMCCVAFRPDAAAGG